jgi:hypothetical protein
MKPGTMLSWFGIISVLGKYGTSGLPVSHPEMPLAAPAE